MNRPLSCRMLFLVLFAKYNNVGLCVYIDRYWCCLSIYIYKMLKYSCFKDSKELVRTFYRTNTSLQIKQGTCGKILKMVTRTLPLILLTLSLGLLFVFFKGFSHSTSVV